MNVTSTPKPCTSISSVKAEGYTTMPYSACRTFQNSNGSLDRISAHQTTAVIAKGKIEKRRLNILVLTMLDASMHK